MKALPVLAALAAASTFASVPAAAQDADGGEKINQLIIYGDDECPKSEGGEITVCARLDESERYRIPPDLRQSDSPDNVPWTNRVKSFEAVGDFGPLSCSAVGLGGELGCTAKMIEAAYEEKKHGNSVKMAELVAKAREERLSTIDEEAAATQARVEQIEKEYMDRLAREDAAAAAASADDAVNPDSNADLATPPGD
ncbi:hypothetical protein GRI89_13470 [Altererythrobacter salegens]|uniref:Uncharacterized protein n=1 Tax=Croceibacterium salegens TaxID=1737568 RepID=A0A6I4SYT6_9SPHN|nr:hypothetical protein [Croceibacterium salegens]MXO60549.1 hypothetical protein [Croceibacterium salegens]